MSSEDNFCRKNEATDTTARLTVELLRSAISQQKLPHSNQAAALIEAVMAVGEQHTSSNPSDGDNKLVPSLAALEAISFLRPPTLPDLLESMPDLLESMPDLATSHPSHVQYPTRRNEI